MKVVRSFRFGNKHVRVVDGTPSLADMVNEGYNVLYGRQDGANYPNSWEGNQYGPTWTTINTLIVFPLGGWMTLAAEIEKSNGASRQYTLTNATIFLTEGKYGTSWGYKVGSSGSVHLGIQKRGGAFEVIHLENTIITTRVNVGWNALRQLKAPSFRPMVNELQKAKAKLRHVGPTEIKDTSTMGNVGRVVFWPKEGALRMQAAAMRARELEAMEAEDEVDDDDF
jgi:hypothetical protein